jgi:hypothetical protein
MAYIDPVKATWNSSLAAAILLLLLFSPARAAPLTAKQEEVANALKQAFKDMGSPALATRMDDLLKAGRCKFAPIGETAQYDWRTEVISLNSSLESHILDARDPRTRYGNTYGAAMSFAHENKHSQQSAFAYGADTLIEWSGFGNRTERLAWSSTLGLSANWVLRGMKNLSSLPKDSPERVRWLRRLLGMCDAFLATYSSYEGAKSSIGELIIYNAAGKGYTAAAVAKAVTTKQKAFEKELKALDLQVSLPSELSPTGPELSLSAKVSGGVPPYSYVWRWKDEKKDLGTAAGLRTPSREATLVVTVSDSEGFARQAGCRVLPQSVKALPITVKESTYTNPHSGVIYRNLTFDFPTSVAESYRVKISYQDAFSGRVQQQEWPSLDSSVVKTVCAASNPKPGTLRLEIWELGEGGRHGEIRW